MHHSAPYRRFHRLQHVDVLAMLALFAAVWLVWPDAPHPGAPAPVQRMSIAYGEISSESIGFLLYPGHFAFSTPIGFGSMNEAFSAGDPLWTVSGVTPFVEPLPPVSLSAGVPPPPARVLPTLAALPSPAAWTRRPETGDRPPRVHPPDARIELSTALEDRDFHAALLPGRLAELAQSSGELQAFLHLSPEGRVVSVVFLPSGFDWETLRPLEAALLRGVASPGPAHSAGWLWIRWQNPENTAHNPSSES